ncbi:CocE/NonD family hydrolase [Desulfonatronum parangueonense]
MRIIERFPSKVTVHENIFIPMADGVRLAARLWLPEDAEINPVPLILEYIPYRKRDLSRLRDAQIHHYYAGHGYACLRVDIRGSGDSEGVLTDEYLEIEQSDGEQILKWAAAQPWCNGNAGMIGISWGGFNGLQIAARRPPELKAIITVCSTDDRYADDIHFMGGCLLGDNLSWSAVMHALNSLPPDPQIVGEKWREMWLKRLADSGLWLDRWMRHQQRDAYWKHGSICEDYAAIRVPVMAVSGWADGYSNAVLRLLANLDVPRQGLIGPWSHLYPHLGKPGPAIGFLQESLRWWDKWLKGRESGIMDEPMLRVYMQDSVPPKASYDYRPGRWIGEPSWPSPNIEMQAFTLQGNHLVPGIEDWPRAERTISSPLTVGLAGGKWCSYLESPDLPWDQREDDSGSMVFESDPLRENLEILGQVEVELSISVDQPMAMVAVRLSDVAPDGKATRTTYGLLNLSHRESHEFPEPLIPGKNYKVNVKLNDTAQVFPAGNRLRISISTSYWPVAWPAPRPACLTVQTGVSRVLLPVRVRSTGDRGMKAFLPAEGAPAPIIQQRTPARQNWLITRDLGAERATLEVINNKGVFYIAEIDLEVEEDTREYYSSQADDFDSVRGEVRSVMAFKRGDWHIRTITRTVMTSDVENFRLYAELDAYENGSCIMSKNWNHRIPRNLL